MDDELKLVLLPIVQSLQLSIRVLKEHHEELIGLNRWKLALNRTIHAVNPNMLVAVDLEKQNIADQGPQAPLVLDATLRELAQMNRSLDSIVELLRK